MQYYKVPFDLENFEDFLTSQDIDNIARKYKVTVNQDEEFATGTADQLANFFQALDGPAQSFPITEFLEYIQQFKLV